LIDHPKILNGISVPYEEPAEVLRGQLQPAGPRAWAAMLALGYHPSSDAFAILLDQLSSPDWRYRRSALDAIPHHPLVNAAQDKIGQLLTDPSAYVRRTACVAIGKLQARQFLPQLMSWLSSHDIQDRSTVLDVLPSIWEASLFEPVLRVFRLDDAEKVRRKAGFILRDTVEENHWRILFDLWKQGPLSRYRVWTCQLVEQFGKGECDLELQDLLKDRDGHVRKAARKALGLPNRESLTRG
jgi:HEAT repeat protein